MRFLRLAIAAGFVCFLSSFSNFLILFLAFFIGAAICSSMPDLDALLGNLLGVELLP